MSHDHEYSEFFREMTLDVVRSLSDVDPDVKSGLLVIALVALAESVCGAPPTVDRQISRNVLQAVREALYDAQPEYLNKILHLLSILGFDDQLPDIDGPDLAMYVTTLKN